MISILKNAADYLLSGIEHIRYTIILEKASTLTVCRKALETLFPMLDEISITHDSSGAPIATVQYGNTISNPLVSLTDENGFSACFAVDPVEASYVIGVGIDMADIDDLSPFLLTPSHKRLNRIFFSDEADHIQSLPVHEQAAQLAAIFSAKEAAFKSLCGIYRTYRRENNGKPLDVSMMDFGFAQARKPLQIAKVRGMSAEICAKENLELHCRTVILGDHAGAVVMCRRKSHYISGNGTR